jgi:two-component system cell cycle sensor histidine kinase/response regulator CckA
MDTSINILRTLAVGTFVLLMLTAGVILAVVQSKRREMAAKQREIEELSKRERKYRNLFDNSLAGMIRLDAGSWNVLEANHALLDLLGAATNEEVKLVLETMPGTARQQILDALAARGSIENLETTICRFDQSEVCISISASLFSQENLIEGVVIDVTERKRLEAKHLRTQRTESIGVLATGMAHDIQNLLVPVRLASDMLKRKTEDQQSKEILDSIAVSAESSIDLVRQVLAFVRGVEGKHVPLPIADLVRRALHAIQETLPQGIELESKLSNTTATVSGDAAQLRQVLVNLVNNAKDSMPNGGCLKVTLERVHMDKMAAELIPNGAEGTYVVLSVADTGIGISPERIEKIFEPFYTTKEIGKGTGLGLSIVSGIVKGHNGFVTLKSEVGKGTTFSVYLPAVAEESKAAAS